MADRVDSGWPPSQIVANREDPCQQSGAWPLRPALDQADLQNGVLSMVCIQPAALNRSRRRYHPSMKSFLNFLKQPGSDQADRNHQSEEMTHGWRIYIICEKSAHSLIARLPHPSIPAVARHHEVPFYSRHRGLRSSMPYPWGARRRPYLQTKRKILAASIERDPNWNRGPFQRRNHCTTRSRNAIFSLIQHHFEYQWGLQWFQGSRQHLFLPNVHCSLHNLWGPINLWRSRWWTRNVQRGIPCLL